MVRSMVSDPSPHLYLFKYWQRDHERWLRAGKTGNGQLQVQNENLRGILAVGGDFRLARFTGCDLSFANINSATLNAAEFRHCTLEGTVFAASDINDAIIEDCMAARINLNLAHLYRTGIRGGDFKEATFGRASLTGAIVEDVDLSAALLEDSVLDGAVFRRCRFDESSFRRVDMGLELARAFGTRFEECDLRGANVAGWRLKDTTFEGCAMYGITGTPAFEGSVQVRADLSPGADGTTWTDAQGLGWT